MTMIDFRGVYNKGIKPMDMQEVKKYCEHTE